MINEKQCIVWINVFQFNNGTYTRTGVITSSKAKSLTFGRVRCSVTGTLPLTGLLISVSNDGKTQSDSLLFIIQDTVCYSCNATEGQCSLQVMVFKLRFSVFLISFLQSSRKHRVTALYIHWFSFKPYVVGTH